MKHINELLEFEAPEIKTIAATLLIYSGYALVTSLSVLFKATSGLSAYFSSKLDVYKSKLYSKMYPTDIGDCKSAALDTESKVLDEVQESSEVSPSITDIPKMSALEIQSGVDNETDGSIGEGDVLTSTQSKSESQSDFVKEDWEDSK